MFARMTQDFFYGSRQDSGAVAIIFGLVAVVLTGLAGMAIDTSRAYTASSHALAALDSAALAAAKGMNTRSLSDDEVRELAQQVFDANTASQGSVSFQPVDVVINRAEGSVTVSVVADVPTTLARVMNYDKFTVSRSVTAIYKMKDVELAMMLDVSGSMWGQKIADLKNAARDVMDILMPVDGADKVKIALAPYSTSVNAGDYADSVTGGQSTACVSERAGAAAFTDDDPSVESIGARARSCPAATIQPLTNDKATLAAQIDSLNAGGWTAGHLGVAWAWYLVSPNWANIWPAASQPVAYGDDQTIKAVILMTDGEFNTTYVASNGSSSEQAIELCNNMKNNQVVVYSVAFQAPPSAEATLQNCASSPQHYFDAQNGDQLRAAFQTIAMRLANLRLAK